MPQLMFWSSYCDLWINRAQTKDDDESGERQNLREDEDTADVVIKHKVSWSVEADDGQSSQRLGQDGCTAEGPISLPKYSLRRKRK